MAATIQIKSSINTPQAVNDSLGAFEDLLSYLCVLENDGGGNAAQLYGLMDSGLSTELIASALQSPVSSNYLTGLGATASIVTSGPNAGTISYDASALDLAEGETATDTFSYVIQLGNGTFSIATVTVTITGSNDQPMVSDVIVGAGAGVIEDGAAYRGQFVGDDVDSDDNPGSLTYLILSQPTEGSVTIDPDHAAGFVFNPGTDFQDLGEGDTRIVSFSYQAMDSHGALSDPKTVSITVTGAADITGGTVIDGYIANALVFRDSNNNNVWDHEPFVDANGNGLFDTGESFTDEDGSGSFNSESFTTTDSEGNFTGLGGIGRIVITPLIGPGGESLTTDISTGDAWTGLYSAPAGSSVVTPLTTLVDAIAGPTASTAQIAAAKTLVAGALGIDPSINLTAFDPLAAIAGSTDPVALALAVEVQKIAVQVANIIAVTEQTLAAAGVEDGSGLAAAALADLIETSGGSTDLTSSTLIESVLVDAAAASSDAAALAAVEAQSGAIADSLASINDVIDGVDGTGDPLLALAQVVAAQIVAQENLGAEAAGAVSDGDPVDAGSYDGSSLVDQLDAAAGEVETIIPQDNTGSTLGAPGRPAVDDGVRVNTSEIVDGIVVTVAYDQSAGVVAGDSLRLLLGGVEVATYTLAAADISSGGTLVHAFTVSSSALGVDGAKVLTAQFATQAGIAGPASLPALITVDTLAPTAPRAIHLVEGTIISAVDAADGTQITGETEADSKVSFTFTNGTSTLVKEAVTTGSSFTLTLSAAEIAALGEGYVTFSAVATDVAGNASGASLTGQYFHTLYPVVDPETRIDGAGVRAAVDSDININVTALAGGGFAVHWLTDTDGNNDADTLVTQNYLADGAKDGAPVLLQGLGSNITDLGDNVGAYQLAELADGGYALAYTMERETDGKVVTLGANTPLGFGGAPIFLNVSGAPAGTTFRLLGTETSGNAVNVLLNVVDGQIHVPQTLLDTLANPNRAVIIASQTCTVFVETEQSVIYDTDSATSLVHAAGSIWPYNAAFSIGILSTNDGRVEGFHLDAPAVFNTVVDAPREFRIVISVPFNPYSISLAGVVGTGGISAASVNDAGQIVLNFNNLGQTNFAIPQSILNQIGDRDMGAALLGVGIVPGTASFSGNVDVRAEIALPEGVFVQTFDAAGNATSDGSLQLDGPASRYLQDDEAAVDVSPLADGGFAVHWLADTTDDGDGDTLAIQRFGADGQPDGGVTLLQGLSANLLDNTDNFGHLDLTALDNGGYALAYTIEREVDVRMATLGNNGQVVFAGVPISINIFNAPAGAIYTLREVNSLGNAVDLILTPVDGEIHLSQAVLDTLENPKRASLIVTGLAAGQTAVLGIETEQAVRYDTQAATIDQVRLGTILPVGAANLGVLVGLGGRSEGFHLYDQLIFSSANVNKLFQVVINVSFPANSINLAGVVNTGGIVDAGVNQAGQLVLSFNTLTQTHFAIPQTILDQIGERDMSAYLLAIGVSTAVTSFTGSVDVRAEIAIPQGVFVQTFDGDGIATSAGDFRVDGPGAYLIPEDDDETQVDVTALAGGGFAVQWVADTDGDSEADTAAIQRFDASGAATGSLVTLQDIPEILLADTDTIADVDIAVLDNGGYVMSYVAELETYEKQIFFTTPANTSVLNVALMGRPLEVDVNAAPAGAVFKLVGQTSAGQELKLTVVPDAEGEIRFTQAQFDQFANAGRLILEVSGLAQNNQVVLNLQSQQTVSYDQDAALVTSSVSSTASTFGRAGLVVIGRAESFHVDAVSFAGAPQVYLLLINTAVPVNLAGISGASYLPNGTIQIVYSTTGLTTFSVPQAILNQVGDADMSAVLVGTGLVPGSTFRGTVSARPGEALTQEGVFVQAFDAEGNPTSNDLDLTATADANLLRGDVGDDLLVGTGSINVLGGGAGADTFVFAPSGQGYQAVLDFEPGSDVIDLSAFDAIAGTPLSDDPFTFIGGNPFTGVAGQMNYTTTAEGLTINMDTNGDGTGDIQIVVFGQSLIHPEDLVL